MHNDNDDNHDDERTIDVYQISFYRATRYILSSCVCPSVCIIEVEWVQIEDFRPTSRYISETAQDMDTVTVEH